MESTAVDTRRLDGNKIAGQIQEELRGRIAELGQKGLTPGLAAVLVGDNPASRLYVESKTRTCRELKLHSLLLHLPADITTRELLGRIGRLNRDDAIDGILVQLPLPSQIDREAVLGAVNPTKDVDGFHPVNAGKLALGNPALVPCTPLGIVELLKREAIPLEGAHAVIIGRSNIVGKPLAQLLLRENCTVTIAHSRTRNLPSLCRRADLLVAAVGRPAMVTRGYIKPGAAVVDVGTNVLTRRQQVVELFGPDSPRLRTFDRRGSTLVGDVHPRHPWGVAAAVTPVPGGVGPLTIAMLMHNTVLACVRRRANCNRKEPRS